jgi:pimeloyl-ACP methyl ester carboxylesterase
MGGVVSGIFGGIRPQRVARLAVLEGLGLARRPATDAPLRYAEWLDELRDPPRFRPYASFDEVAARLKRNNPRLTADKAAFLAGHWARRLESGEVVLVSDPRHKMANPVLFRIDEALACWKRVTAPTLLVFGKDSNISRRIRDTPGQFAERRDAFANRREVEIENCGHMMHHDQPERLAAVLEDFFLESEE